MRITPPTMPHHVAKAYGVTPPSTVRPPQSITPSEGRPSGETVKKLVAGVVPGGIDFSGAEATPSVPSMKFYRHPADQNAAATSAQAGRVIDIDG